MIPSSSPLCLNVLFHLQFPPPPCPCQGRNSVLGHGGQREAEGYRSWALVGSELPFSVLAVEVIQVMHHRARNSRVLSRNHIWVVGVCSVWSPFVCRRGWSCNVWALDAAEAGKQHTLKGRSVKEADKGFV